MHYSGIKANDIANGDGVRVSIWISGCERHCKGCFNPETWDREFGSEFREDDVQRLLSLLRPDHIKGLSLLGGDPLMQYNRKAVLDLILRVKKELPSKDIWLYTGYTYEQVLEFEDCKEILENIDVLVDGPFIEEFRDSRLRFCGSSNQRVIRLREL